MADTDVQIITPSRIYGIPENMNPTPEPTQQTESQISQQAAALEQTQAAIAAQKATYDAEQAKLAELQQQYVPKVGTPGYVNPAYERPYQQQFSKVSEQQKQLSLGIEKYNIQAEAYKQKVAEAQTELAKLSTTPQTAEDIAFAEQLYGRGFVSESDLVSYKFTAEKNIDAKIFAETAKSEIAKIDIAPNELADIEFVQGLLGKGYISSEDLASYKEVAQKNITNLEFGKKLESIAEGKDVVHIVNIQTSTTSRHGDQILEFVGRTDAGGRYSNEYSSGDMITIGRRGYVHKTPEQAIANAVEATRQKFGLNETDEIYVDGKLYQKSILTPEQLAIAKEVSSGTLSIEQAQIAQLHARRADLMSGYGGIVSKEMLAPVGTILDPVAYAKSLGLEAKPTQAQLKQQMLEKSQFTPSSREMALAPVGADVSGLIKMSDVESAHLFGGAEKRAGVVSQVELKQEHLASLGTTFGSPEAGTFSIGGFGKTTEGEGGKAAYDVEQYKTLYKSLYGENYDIHMPTSFIQRGTSEQVKTEKNIYETTGKTLSQTDFTQLSETQKEAVIKTGLVGITLTKENISRLSDKDTEKLVAAGVLSYKSAEIQPESPFGTLPSDKITIPGYEDFLFNKTTGMFEPKPQVPEKDLLGKIFGGIESLELGFKQKLGEVDKIESLTSLIPKPTQEPIATMQERQRLQKFLSQENLTSIPESELKDIMSPIYKRMGIDPSKIPDIKFTSEKFGAKGRFATELVLYPSYEKYREAHPDYTGKLQEKAIISTRLSPEEALRTTSHELGHGLYKTTGGTTGEQEPVAVISESKFIDEFNKYYGTKIGTSDYILGDVRAGSPVQKVIGTASDILFGGELKPYVAGQLIAKTPFVDINLKEEYKGAIPEKTIVSEVVKAIPKETITVGKDFAISSKYGVMVPKESLKPTFIDNLFGAYKVGETGVATPEQQKAATEGLKPITDYWTTKYLYEPNVKAQEWLQKGLGEWKGILPSDVRQTFIETHPEIVPLSQFGGGVIKGAASLPLFGAQLAVGGEVIAKQPEAIVKLAPAGIAIMAGSTIGGFKTDPFGTVGQFAGMAIGFKVIGMPFEGKTGIKVAQKVTITEGGKGLQIDVAGTKAIISETGQILSKTAGDTARYIGDVTKLTEMADVVKTTGIQTGKYFKEIGGNAVLKVSEGVGKVVKPAITIIEMGEERVGRVAEYVGGKAERVGTYLTTELERPIVAGKEVGGIIGKSFGEVGEAITEITSAYGIRAGEYFGREIGKPIKTAQEMQSIVSKLAKDKIRYFQDEVSGAIIKIKTEAGKPVAYFSDTYSFTSEVLGKTVGQSVDLWNRTSIKVTKPIILVSKDMIGIIGKNAEQTKTFFKESGVDVSNYIIEQVEKPVKSFRELEDLMGLREIKGTLDVAGLKTVETFEGWGRAAGRTTLKPIRTTKEILGKAAERTTVFWKETGKGIKDYTITATAEPVRIFGEIKDILDVSGLKTTETFGGWGKTALKPVRRTATHIGEVAQPFIDPFRYAADLTETVGSSMVLTGKFLYDVSPIKYGLKPKPSAILARVKLAQAAEKALKESAINKYAEKGKLTEKNIQKIMQEYRNDLFQRDAAAEGLKLSKEEAKVEFDRLVREGKFNIPHEQEIASQLGESVGDIGKELSTAFESAAERLKPTIKTSEELINRNVAILRDRFAKYQQGIVQPVGEYKLPGGGVEKVLSHEDYIKTIDPHWWGRARGWTDGKDIYIDSGAIYLDPRDYNLLIKHEVGHIQGLEHEPVGVMSAYGGVRYVTSPKVVEKIEISPETSRFLKEFQFSEAKPTEFVDIIVEAKPIETVAKKERSVQITPEMNRLLKEFEMPTGAPKLFDDSKTTISMMKKEEPVKITISKETDKFLKEFEMPTGAPKLFDDSKTTISMMKKEEPVKITISKETDKFLKEFEMSKGAPKKFEEETTTISMMKKEEPIQITPETDKFLKEFEMPMGAPKLYEEQKTTISLTKKEEPISLTPETKKFIENFQFSEKEPSIFLDDILSSRVTEKPKTEVVKVSKEFARKLKEEGIIKKEFLLDIKAEVPKLEAKVELYKSKEKFDILEEINKPLTKESILKITEPVFEKMKINISSFKDKIKIVSPEEFQEIRVSSGATYEPKAGAFVKTVDGKIEGIYIRSDMSLQDTTLAYIPHEIGHKVMGLGMNKGKTGEAAALRFQNEYLKEFNKLYKTKATSELDISKTIKPTEFEQMYLDAQEMSKNLDINLRDEFISKERPRYTDKEYIREKLKDTYRTEPLSLEEQYGGIPTFGHDVQAKVGLNQLLNRKMTLESRIKHNPNDPFMQDNIRRLNEINRQIENIKNVPEIIPSVVAKITKVEQPIVKISEEPTVFNYFKGRTPAQPFSGMRGGGLGEFKSSGQRIMDNLIGEKGTSGESFGDYQKRVLGTTPKVSPKKVQTIEAVKEKVEVKELPTTREINIQELKEMRDAGIPLTPKDLELLEKSEGKVTSGKTLTEKDEGVSFLKMSTEKVTSVARRPPSVKQFKTTELTPEQRTSLAADKARKGKNWMERELSLKKEEGGAQMTKQGQIVLTKQLTKQIVKEKPPEVKVKEKEVTITKAKEKVLEAQKEKIKEKEKTKGILYITPDVKLKEKQRLKQEEVGMLVQIDKPKEKQKEKERQREFIGTIQVPKEFTSEITMVSSITAVKPMIALKPKEKEAIKERAKEIVKPKEILREKEIEAVKEVQREKQAEKQAVREIQREQEKLILLPKKSHKEDETRKPSKEDKEGYKYKFRASPIFGGAEKLFEGDKSDAIFGKPKKAKYEGEKEIKSKKKTTKKSKDFWEV